MERAPNDRRKGEALNAQDALDVRCARVCLRRRSEFRPRPAELAIEAVDRILWSGLARCGALGDCGTSRIGRLAFHSSFAFDAGLCTSLDGRSRLRSGDSTNEGCFPHDASLRGAMWVQLGISAALFGGGRSPRAPWLLFVRLICKVPIRGEARPRWRGDLVEVGGHRRRRRNRCARRRRGRKACFIEGRLSGKVDLGTGSYLTAHGDHDFIVAKFPDEK